MTGLLEPGNRLSFADIFSFSLSFVLEDFLIVPGVIPPFFFSSFTIELLAVSNFEPFPTNLLSAINDDFLRPVLGLEFERFGFYTDSFFCCVDGRGEIYGFEIETVGLDSVDNFVVAGTLGVWDGFGVVGRPIDFFGVVGAFKLVVGLYIYFVETVGLSFYCSFNPGLLVIGLYFIPLFPFSYIFY